MKLSEVRKEAREALTGRWGKGVSIVLAFFLVEFAIGFITGLFEEGSILSLVMAIIQTIISIPLSFGLAFTFLKLKRNEDVSAFDFWGLGMENFSRAWRIAGRTILKMIVPIIIFVLCIAAFVGTTTYYVFALASGTETVPVIVIVIGLIIYIAAIIYLLSVALLYELTSLVAYDNKDMTALEVVNESAKLMKGNRWKIILLELSFIGWLILGVFTFGIGYLWLIPYMEVATVCFYEKLAQVKTDVKDEENTENPIQEQ